MEDEEESLQSISGNQKEIKREKGLWSSIWAPMNWFKMLSEELHWTFVVGVVIVYGISQGLAVGLSRVSTQYYMKDEQKLQPSESQIYLGLIQIPWMIKPLWGLMTDTVPVLGYRRKPYFFLAGLLGVASMLVLSSEKTLHLAFALLCLMGGSAGIAIADVTIDACITQNSISHPSLAADMQSLCGMSSSVGALVGFSLSGFFVHILGPQGVFGLLSIPPGLVILVGIMVKETNFRDFTNRRVGENFLDAAKTMWTTLRCRDVWRPCIYMFTSLAFGLNIREGMFYWYTDAKEGPSFSQEVVGSIFSVGALGSLLGVLLYQNALKNYPFRGVLLWSQLLYGLSGLLDLILVLRVNLKLGLPDYFFVVFDEGFSMLIGRVKWMPILVLSSKLCPSGIEGTFFALLMSIDHVGILVSSWGGGFLLHILTVTRTRFDNLWIAILIRSVFRIIPIWLLFLIPTTDPNSSGLPVEIRKAEKADESTEMASLVNSN